ncbi:MAG: GGDEF domain-containing protein, partial [Candidatus Gracilibacteria bacterium]|nr:GGDEF domain-containing protein [Candidatus Gracilibacteria bacterium]
EIYKLALYDDEFKNYLYSYIKENVSKILDDSSIKSFEEINFLLYLLGVNKDYDILKNIFNNNFHDFTEIDNLLEEYYKNISNLENTENIFNYISTLEIFLDVLNKVILFGFNYFQENKNTVNLLNLTINKINKFIVLFDMKNDNHEFDEHLDTTRTILGRYKLMFATNLNKNEEIEDNQFEQKKEVETGGQIIIEQEIEKEFQEIDEDLVSNYSDIDEENLKKEIKFYSDIFETQIDGYNNIKTSKYGNGNTDELKVNIAFIGNVTVNLLDLIAKLKNKSYQNEEELLKEIISNYRKYINDKFIFSDIFSFEKELISNLYRVYKLSSNDNMEHKKLNDIIMQFLQKKDVNYYELEVIWNLLKYSEYNEIDKLLLLGNNLLQNKYESSYYEKFKLNIISVILKKIKNIDDSFTKQFVNNLVSYIGHNKVASNLLYSYTDIYLELSIYYSTFDNDESQEKAQTFYYKFAQIHNIENIKKNNKDFLNKYNEIFFNIGKIFLSDVDSGFYLDEENIKFGKKIIGKFAPQYNLKVRDNMHSMLSKSDGLNENIFTFISREMFYGICEIKLIHGDKKNHLPRGYKSAKIPLSHGYFIYFKYPEIYEYRFMNIFNKEYVFIEENIGALIMKDELNKDLELDIITGFYNEGKFKQNLLAIKEKSNFVILKFKSVADVGKAYSPEVGDKYLQAISKLLKNVFDSSIAKKFYRSSSTTFIIELKKEITNETYIKKLFSKIQDASLDLGKLIDIDNVIFQVSKSKFGVVLGEDKHIYEKLLMTLDDEKTDVTFYGSGLKDKLSYRENMETLSMVQEALKNNRIVPFFQPIVDLKTGEIHKYEALVRLINKDGSFIPPDKFIPNIKNAGRTSDIAIRMVDKIFEFIGRNKNISVSINLYGKDFLDEKIMNFIDEQIFKYHLEDITDHISFEILENEFPKDKNIIDEVCFAIKKYKKKGFKISLDDFGSESQNFDRLYDFMSKGLLDYVKIDGNIIKNMQKDDFLKESLLGIISGSNKTGIKVIAEYVEDKEILNELKSIGVDFGQGYYFSKPISLEEVNKQILNQKLEK